MRPIVVLAQLTSSRGSCYRTCHGQLPYRYWTSTSCPIKVVLDAVVHAEPGQTIRPVVPQCQPTVKRSHLELLTSDAVDLQKDQRRHPLRCLYCRRNVRTSDMAPVFFRYVPSAFTDFDSTRSMLWSLLVCIRTLATSSGCVATAAIEAGTKSMERSGNGSAGEQARRTGHSSKVSEGDFRR